MNRPRSIGPAQIPERAAALRMIFAATGDPAVRNALDLMRLGDLDPAGLWVVRDSIGIAAAMLAAVSVGRSAIVWPPVTRPSLHTDDDSADLAAAAVVGWLADQPVRFAQCLLPPDDAGRAEPLLRHGFRRVTRLLDLHHYLDLSAEDLARRERLDWIPYSECDPAEFERLLESTYVDSLDCPEINGVRTAGDAIAEYQANDGFRADFWWLARRRGEAVGMVMLASNQPGECELSYVGVVPEHRGRGHGREMIRRALFEAKAAGLTQLSLAVDERNVPARRIYQRAGFEPGDVQDVYLTIFAGRE